MKGFRRFWVRSASLAWAIIGCREPMQADTIRRARLIRARVAEVVGPVWARGASAVRFWLGLGRADAGCCGLDFGLDWAGAMRAAVGRYSCLRLEWRAVLGGLLLCGLLPGPCCLRLEFVACRASSASCAARCVWPTGAQHSSSPLYFPDCLLLCVFVEIVSRFRLFWQRIAVVNDLKEV